MKIINYRSFVLAIIALMMSCTSPEKPTQEKTEAEFINIAKDFHNLYITAGDCEKRNAMIHKDIIFYENRKTFTYQNILEYCSYIIPKQPFDIYSKQYLIRSGVGFDYVDQYYLNSEQDTIREISSRIWELKSNQWLVTYMQVSKHD